MRSEIFFFFLIFSTALSQEFDDICVPGDGSECNTDHNLICLPSEPFTNRCKCNNQSIEDPTTVDPDLKCFVYPTETDQRCIFLPNVENTCREIPGAICGPENTCICNATSHFETPSISNCTSFATALHQPCPHQRECEKIFGAVCEQLGSETLCMCNSTSHVEFGRSCYEKAEVGGVCNVTSQCIDSSPFAVCDGGICSCPSPYVPHPNEPGCLDSVRELNGNCVQGSEQCSGIFGAYCNAQNVCECNTTLYANDYRLNLCRPWPANLNSSCAVGTIPEHCSMLPNAVCNVFACGCKSDSVLNDDGTLCVMIKTKIGASCTDMKECSGIEGEAVCGGVGVGQNCICPSTTHVPVYSPGLLPDKCLAMSSANGPCDHTAQCTPSMGQFAECNLSGRCSCQSSAGLWMGSCFRRVPVNSLCVQDEECIVGSNERAACLPSTDAGGNSILTCQCRAGSQYSPSEGLCIGGPLVGGECSSQADCAFRIEGLVVCTNGRCTCGFAHRPSFDNTRCTNGNERLGEGFIWLVLLGLSAIVNALLKI